ncbi:MAG: aldehyde dehydrogenase [Candidatus Fischerbacteria bacterium RBG_13_37_8]|uniref:Aldehyde dehydrogenase n=1 Tax=Candidatus Fischerbacteria bacterium RBG_13_37_8 TaxID=1817863 RepID=A0A1F5VXR7_9BACT|nr:MAG: aldehyde dehydrogenase [Candidatus Fischerbacteria bacterium RBG_13_37_8]
MKFLLDGKWVDRKNKIDVRDPYDNSLIDTVPRGTAQDVEVAISAAVKGFQIMKRLTVYDRAQILFKAAAIIKADLASYAEIIAREGSKTIREARKEANRCTNTLTVAAEESKRLFGETIPFDSFPGGEKRRGYYYRFPIGVVLAITPFNDPLNLVAHKLGPAIAAGNSVILKPATVTPLSALKLAEALLEAGLPPLGLQVITGYGSEIGDALAQDERIRMISFTGGVEAGKQIAEVAGIKKIGMELGSNSPVIVWKDVDIPSTVDSCVSGAFWAAGQNCIGVQRIYIHKEIYEAFKKAFVKRTSKYKIGDKMKEETDMGPMINEEEAKRVDKWVREAVNLGAKVLYGGKRKGSLFEPTVLEKVPVKATIHREEVFGPTVNLYPIATLEEAIEKSNSVKFGLHAAIFTKDVDVAFKAAYELDCGGVMINDSTDYRLDSMPFGGVKYSGLGREGLKFSLLEMTEPKVISFYLPNI